MNNLKLWVLALIAGGASSFKSLFTLFGARRVINSGHFVLRLYDHAYMLCKLNVWTGINFCNRQRASICGADC